MLKPGKEHWDDDYETIYESGRGMRPVRIGCPWNEKRGDTR